MKFDWLCVFFQSYLVTCQPNNCNICLWLCHRHVDAPTYVPKPKPKPVEAPVPVPLPKQTPMEAPVAKPLPKRVEALIPKPKPKPEPKKTEMLVQAR